MTSKTIIETLEVLAQDHIICGGQKIVSWLGYDKKYVYGFNRYKTHPIQKRYGRKPGSIFLHSEIDAIQKFLSHYIEIWKTTLYICRVVQGQRSWGKPCSGCMQAISAFSIKHVIYSTPGGFIKLF